MKATATAAPALCRHLIQSFEHFASADIDEAFATALDAVAADDRDAKTHLMAEWVQERAEADMDDWDSQSGAADKIQQAQFFAERESEE